MAASPASAPAAELWACDGCTFTGTATECDTHVDSQVLRADGTVVDWADVVCHGSYLVGGPAWEAHVFHGVHPMSVLIADIRDAVTGSTLNLPEVSMSTTTNTLSTSSRDLAVLRARVSGDMTHLRAFVSTPAELGDACPRCQSADVCPQWCVEADETELWACDGCTFTGTADDCDTHIDSQVLRADGSVADWADVVCHGSYLVGGPAWEAHVFHGVHPMSVVVADLRDVATRHADR